MSFFDSTKIIIPDNNLNFTSRTKHNTQEHENTGIPAEKVWLFLLHFEKYISVYR